MKATKTRYQQGSISRIQRTNGYAWRVRFSEWEGGKRRQRSLTFDGTKYPNEIDVRKVINVEVVKQNRATERSKVDALFGDITTLYREDHLPTLEPSTRQTNAYLLRRYVEPRFEHEPIRKVTPLAVINWMKELPLAPSTKAAIRSVLSQCFELAALHEFTPATERNPMSLVRIKGSSKRQKKIAQLTIAQFRTLIESLPEPINIMALVAGSLGLRISELVALKWTDIDWAERTISISRKYTHGALGRTKTAASEAKLPLDGGLLSILEGWKPKTNGSEWLFPSPRTGGPRSAAMLRQKGLKPIARELGLGDVGFHALRHACRSWLSSGGAAVGTQKDLLRHSDISTTMNVYGHALSEDMRRAHEELAAKLLG